VRLLLTTVLCPVNASAAVRGPLARAPTNWPIANPVAIYEGALAVGENAEMLSMGMRKATKFCECRVKQ
jgi:hypothetical protein